MCGCYAHLVCVDISLDAVVLESSATGAIFKSFYWYKIICKVTF